MKNLFIVLLLCISHLGIAQAPNAIPYQGVARNAGGDVLSNQSIGLRISIRDLTAGGTIVYRETHSVTTTNLGLFTVNIGTGTPIQGTLSGVNWGSGAKFVQVEMDPAGGTSYLNMGTTQLMSVPYALFAGSGGNLPSGSAFGNTLRWNGTAWVANNNIYNSGSQVGIGTSAPAAKLDIAGNIKITDGSQGSGKVLKSDANGLASWGIVQSTDMLNSPVPAKLSCPAVMNTVTTGAGPLDIAISGTNVLMANFSGTLEIFNSINPSDPVLSGSLSIGGALSAVQVLGNYAYVTNYGNNEMHIINIANPTMPTLAATIPTGDNPISLAVSGNNAFVVNLSSNTLQVFNISNPASPSLLGSVATGSSPYSVAVSGSYAYVTNFSGNAMQIFNVSNPTSPVLSGSLVTGGNPIAVAVSGAYAYVANYGINSLQVINISNPSSPTLAGTVTTGNNPRDLVQNGNYVVVVNYGDNTLQVVNISNAASPVVEGTTATNNGANSVTLSGNYAYVVNYLSNNMQIINLACPQDFTFTHNPATGQTTAIPLQWKSSGNNLSNADTTGKVGIGTANPTAKLDIAGTIKIKDGTQGAGKVLVSDANGNASWGTLNASNLFQNSLPPVTLACPTVKFSMNMQFSGTPLTMRFVGDRLYVLYDGYFTVYTFFPDGTLNYYWNVSVIPGCTSLDILGNYAYVGLGDSDGIYIYDISTPYQSQLVNNIGTSFNVEKFLISGNYGYALGYNLMQVFNLSNPLSISSVGSVALNIEPYRVDLVGNYIYITGEVYNLGQIYLKVVDISNPAVPAIIGNNLFNENVRDILVLGNNFYVVTPTFLKIYSISNSFNPTLLSQIYIGSGGNSIEISGNYAYVTGDYLKVINISNPNSPAETQFSNVYSSQSLLVFNGNFLYLISTYSFQIVDLLCPSNLGISVNSMNGQTMPVSPDWIKSGNKLIAAGINYVGIGKTNPSNTVDVGGNICIGFNGGFNVTAPSNGAIIEGNVGIGTTQASQKLSVSGNICATGSIGACSDNRYKKDINPLENSLEKVLQMRGVNYRWKVEEFPDKQFNDHRQIGFIAQELEKIVPELVITDDDGYKSVDYAKVTPLLVEAIKQLKAENEQLKAANQEFRDDIRAIKAQLGIELKAER